MKCPNCGATSEGAFCSSCGASLKPGRCAKCQKPLVPGARFCTSCGAPSAGRAAGAGIGLQLRWWIVGAALAGVIILLVLPAVLRDDAPRGGMTPINTMPSGAEPGGPGMPMLSGSMRENADRLFDRVMRAVSAGDTAEADRFAPMAVQAYEASGLLEDDALYHLSLLQTIAADPAAARATAERILARNPRHLLALGAAAEAALAQGEQDAARQYYRRLLDAYEAEQDAPLPEYQDHGRILPEYRADAQRVVGGG